MIFLFIIYVLSYQQVFNIHPARVMQFLPFRFGFNLGGRYSINVTKGGTGDLLFLVATENDIDEFQNKTDNKNFCNWTYSVDYINLIHVKAGKGFATGQIYKKGKYFTTITICNPQDYGYSVILTYTNPNSMLSYEEQPCLIITSFFAVIVSLIFILWLINWSKYFSIKNILHIFVTICLFETVIYDILYSFEYYIRNKSDQNSNLYRFRKIFRILQGTTVFITFFLLTKGLSIIYKNINLIWYILAFILSSIIMITFSLFHYQQFKQTLLTNILLYSSIIYAILLYNNFVNMLNIIKAHMCIIAENGINPKTTPVQLKLKFLNHSMLYIISFLIEYLIYSLFATQIKNYSVYFVCLFIEILELILIVFTWFLFKLQKKTSEGYMMMNNDDNNDEAQVFDVNNLDQFNSFDDPNSSLVSYEEGMVLPPQPKLNKRFVLFCYL